MSTINEPTIEDEEASRRDELARTKILDFRSWVFRHPDAERFSNLAEILSYSEFAADQFLAYDYKLYSYKLIELNRQDLMSDLLEAESAWKIYKTGIESARKALGMGNGYTPAIPIVVVPCGFKDRYLVPCGKDSVPGAVRCEEHGGEWIDPHIRQSYLLSAYARLVEASDDAVDALVDVAVNGKREDARVMAAREILDRAGIRPGVDINIHISGVGSESQTHELAKRLDKIQKNLQAAALIEAKLEADKAEAEAAIVDAEIVGEKEEGGDEEPS